MAEPIGVEETIAGRHGDSRKWPARSGLVNRSSIGTMGSMVEIRRAGDPDAADVRGVHAAAVRTTCRSHYAPDQVEAWVAQFGARADATRTDDALVAVVEGRVRGFAMLDCERAEVRAVYVHPDAGRRGVGDALLHVLERIARLRGLDALHLDASLNAVAFYARHGWVRHGDTVRAFPGGRDIACVAMTKILPALRLAIRDETPTDVDAVRAVECAAFARDDEARLVDCLRDAGAMTLSLVAALDDEIVGHVALSPVSIDGVVSGVLGLGPMAVAPAFQCCAIGSRLVEEALVRVREWGHAGVIVLGHPDYYPRFGFVPASRFGLRYPAPVPDEAFMAAELVTGAFAGHAGDVRYHAAFDAV